MSTRYELEESCKLPIVSIRFQMLAGMNGNAHTPRIANTGINRLSYNIIKIAAAIASAIQPERE